MRYYSRCPENDERLSRTSVLNRRLAWSGRRDSNSRPSPWQGRGASPRRTLQSAEQAWVWSFRPSSPQSWLLLRANRLARSTTTSATSPPVTR